MWKETVVRMVVGLTGIAVGASFVLVLRGAAQADAERLQIAHSAALAAAANSNEEIASLGSRSELPVRRTR